MATFLVVKHFDKKSYKNPNSVGEYKMTKLLLLLNFYTVISATCRRKRDFQVAYEKIAPQKKFYNSHDRVSIRNSLSANLAEFNSKLISIEFSKEERTITAMGFPMIFLNYFCHWLFITSGDSVNQKLTTNFIQLKKLKTGNNFQNLHHSSKYCSNLLRVVEGKFCN